MIWFCVKSTDATDARGQRVWVEGRVGVGSLRQEPRSARRRAKGVARNKGPLVQTQKGEALTFV